MAEIGVITIGVPLSWDSLNAAAANYGASFYLANLRRFEENFERLLLPFRQIYPRTNIGYSYKTNYLPQLILCADALGAYAEVVSQFEFGIATALGVQPTRIIFNGPVKGRSALITALSSGARVNVDSLVELREIVAAGGELPSQPQLGIRCWLGSDTPGSRFGIDLESADGIDALAEFDRTPGLLIAGLHCHFSGGRGAHHYRRLTRALIRLHQTVLRNRPLRYIDVGGGFASSMPRALAAQFPAPPSTFQDYANAIDRKSVV